MPSELTTWRNTAQHENLVVFRVSDMDVILQPEWLKMLRATVVEYTAEWERQAPDAP